MDNILITLDHVGFSYEADESEAQVEALQDISFSICEGEYIAVIGHNGSGKSTLAKLMNAIIQPTTGTITIREMTIDNQPLDDTTLLDIRKTVGMVFQNPDNQLVATLVEEDVAFGPENLGVSIEEIRERVESALSAVGMLAYRNHAPHKLSGGQKQRVAIAGVLAMKPACIVFDESTAMLDPRGRKAILDTMKQLHEEEHISILHITHHMNEAVQANRILVLDDGKLIYDGTPDEVFAHHTHLCEMGLEIPQGAELIKRLKAKGYAIDGDGLEPMDCVTSLLSMMEKGEIR